MKSQSKVMAALAATTIALSSAACTNSPPRDAAASQALQATAVERRAAKGDNHASTQAGQDDPFTFDTVITFNPYSRAMWVEGVSFNGYSGGLNSTFYGVGAGVSNTMGLNNSAFGTRALVANTTGSENSGFGSLALSQNTSGDNNSGFGFGALQINTSGTDNTAIGTISLLNNITGVGNTAVGSVALVTNTAGAGNTATGFGALSGNTTGAENVAAGARALMSNTSGKRNTALGTQAGCTLTSGDNNIYIGNLGRSTESNVIRIGGDGTSATCPDSVTPATQTLTYIAGISGVSVASSDTPAQVYVGADGQLGIQASSRRFKKSIAPLGSGDRLLKLRPVSFRYAGGNHDEQPRALQYGLVAEEVAEVMPELVNFDATGQPFAVNYQFLAPFLLALMKTEHQKIEKQRELLDMLAEQNKALRQDITDLRRLLTERSAPPVR